MSGQHRSICRLERRSVDLASEDCHLAAQHDDLDGEIGVASANESDELEGAAERQVEEREGHCWMLDARRARVQASKCRSQAMDDILGTDTRNGRRTGVRSGL